MVEGAYGYSVWLVPMCANDLRARYGMRHTPHITVATNLREPRTDMALGTVHRVEGFSDYLPFPRMYEHDPLRGWGFYCNIVSLTTPHRPHMTVTYDRRDVPMTTRPPNASMECVLCLADTRSYDPREWVLLPASP
jgi:hypothetical protein